MCTEKKQDVELMFVPSKMDDINHCVTLEYHKEFQETHEYLPRKDSDGSGYSNEKNQYLLSSTNSSLQLINEFGIEEISIPSIETQNKSDTWKCDTAYSTRNETKSTELSKNNITRQLEHTLWKYRNPYSVSIYDCTHCETSITSDNILNEDEPQEGKTKRSILFDCREYLANYQESCGTPRTEYSFAALIMVMIQATACSLWALLNVFINIVPIIQMFTFILRFVLDKVISIRRTKELRQVLVKFIILVVQLLSVYICLIFILGIIVFPIVQMAVGIAAKLMIHDKFVRV